MQVFCILTLPANVIEAQVAPKVAGQEVHGYITAAFPKPPGMEEISLPGVRVLLKRETDGQPVPSSAVTTDGRGHFRIPAQPGGKYRLCAEAPNFEPRCSEKTIELADGPSISVPRLVLKPIGRTIYGVVTLRDGSPVAGQVAAVDAAGEKLAGPVQANLSGQYVLARLPSSAGLKVTATYDKAPAAVLPVADEDRINLQIPNSPPVIVSLMATFNGVWVQRAAPGTTVRIAAEASDADGDALHYRWNSSGGLLNSQNEPAIDWKLPSTQQPNTVTLEVTDGKGGIARASTTVFTSTADLKLKGGIVPRESNLVATVPPNIVPPSHDGIFIDPANSMLPCRGPNAEAACNAEAALYYQTIHVFDNNNKPIAPLGTLAGWKGQYGFSADRLTSPPSELRAVYFNNGDLQLGRDMHCLQPPYIRDLSVQFACYVSNFSNTGQAGDNPDPQLSIGLVSQEHTEFATVAMTYSGGSNPLIKFFVFDQNGVAQAEAKLDNDGAKAVPGICIACHGGSYDANAHLAVQTNFLPFDTSSFLYGDLNEEDQRETFRKMNNIVKQTAQVSTISALIDGWYARQALGRTCGVDVIGCGPDNSFIPTGSSCPASAAPQFPTCGWATASAQGSDPKKFYLDVAKVYCRSCHVARPGNFNIQNFTDFSTPDSEVSSAVCHKRMPDAQTPFDRFWLDQNAQSALSAILSAVVPGYTACAK
jgi:hypothetical protein